MRPSHLICARKMGCATTSATVEMASRTEQADVECTDATATIRDRHVESLGKRAHHHGCGWASSLFGGSRVAARSDRRLDSALFVWRDGVFVLCLRHRHISRHRRAFHAATGPALHAGLSADERAVRLQYAAGKHAALARQYDAGSPSTHFVSIAQSILYRGGGFDVVWPQFAFVAVVGALFLAFAILRFRSTSAQAA
jgi:hypothetical protein